MQTQTLVMMARHCFMFLYMFKLFCDFSVILFHVFLWVAK